MSKRHSLWALFVWLLLLGLTAAWGQDSSPQQPAGGTPDSSPQQPAPAYGPDNTTPSIAENPPISGLDMPNLEPHAAPLSYLQAGAHLMRVREFQSSELPGWIEHLDDFGRVGQFGVATALEQLRSVPRRTSEEWAITTRAVSDSSR